MDDERAADAAGSRDRLSALVDETLAGLVDVDPVESGAEPPPRAVPLRLRPADVDGDRRAAMRRVTDATLVVSPRTAATVSVSALTDLLPASTDDAVVRLADADGVTRSDVELYGTATATDEILDAAFELAGEGLLHVRVADDDDRPIVVRDGADRLRVWVAASRRERLLDRLDEATASALERA